MAGHRPLQDVDDGGGEEAVDEPAQRPLQLGAVHAVVGDMEPVAEAPHHLLPELPGLAPRLGRKRKHTHLETRRIRNSVDFDNRAA